MQRDPCVVGKALEKFPEQLGVETADCIASEFDIHEQPRAAGEVDDNPGQSLIQRYMNVSVALDAAFVANGPVKSPTQCNAEILDGVVIIDMCVAHCRDVEVDQPVAGNLIQHVIEKGYPGFTVEPPLAIEIDGNRNPGLLGVTGDGGDSLGHVGLSCALCVTGYGPGMAKGHYPGGQALGLPAWAAHYRESWPPSATMRPS